jgi:hypothetical protein
MEPANMNPECPMNRRLKLDIVPEACAAMRGLQRYVNDLIQAAAGELK